MIIDPRYQLKGAALPAQEFYRPLGYEEPTAAVDLLTQLGEGRLWEHEEGRALLRLLRDLGLALNNVGHKTRQAITIFSEMLQYDTQDNLRARHQLLRCHLDRGDALAARTLLDSHPHDTHCCWLFARALIEHISLALQEPGASEATRDKALLAGSLFCLYTYCNYVNCINTNMNDFLALLMI